MKRLIVVLTILTLSFQSTKAQLFTKEKIKNLENFDQKRWSWGYFLGFNNYDFKFNYEEHPTEDLIVKKNVGFTRFQFHVFG